MNNLNSKNNSDTEFEYALRRMQAKADSQIEADRHLEKVILDSVKNKVAENKQTHRMINWTSWTALACAVFIAVVSVKLMQPDFTTPDEHYIALSELSILPESKKPEFIVRLEHEIAQNKALAVSLNQELRDELNLLEQTYIEQPAQPLYSRIAQVIKEKDNNKLVYCQNSQSFVYRRQSKTYKTNWQQITRQVQLVQVVFDQNGQIVALEPIPNTVTCPV